MDDMDADETSITSLTAATASVGLWCAAVVVGMVGAAYAAVPLYRLLCQLTGFDGTPQRASAPSDVVLDRPSRSASMPTSRPGFALAVRARAAPRWT